MRQFLKSAIYTQFQLREIYKYSLLICLGDRQANFPQPCRLQLSVTQPVRRLFNGLFVPRAPFECFTTSGPQNPSIDVLKQHKIRRLSNFEALNLLNVPSDSRENFHIARRDEPADSGLPYPEIQTIVFLNLPLRLLFPHLLVHNSA